MRFLERFLYSLCIIPPQYWRICNSACLDC